MLTPDVIMAIRTLLERVQLTGKEVPAYNRIMLSLAAEENDGRLHAAQSRVVSTVPVVPEGSSNGAAESSVALEA